MVPKLAWVRGLTPELVKKAELELNETAERRTRSLKDLKELIREENDFSPLMDDGFLLRFLRAKKFDVKRTFKTMKNYYSFKAKYTGTITDLSPKDIKGILETNAVFISPRRCPRGGGILIIYPGTFDLDLFEAEDILSAVIVGAEIGIETEASQVCGSSVIFDLSGMGLRKLRHFSKTSFMSIIIRGLQDCWPHRIMGFHVVNEPSYFGVCYGLVKPLMTKKLRDRMHFHCTDLNALHEYFPPEVLPENLGGHLGEKDFKDFRSILLQNNALVERVNRYIYQGKKYPSNAEHREDNPNETTASLFKPNLR